MARNDKDYMLVVQTFSKGLEMSKKCEITLSFWTGAYTTPTEKYSLERALCGINKAGYDRIELACVPSFAEHIIPEKMKEADFRNLEELLEEFDIKVTAVCGHVDLAGRYTLPGVEGAVDSEKSLGLWKNRIDLAERLGASVLTTGMGRLETKEHYDTFYKYIAKVEDYCSKGGIKVAMETCGGLTGKFFKPIMERLDSKWIGINYDTADTRYWNGINAEDDIENVMNWIMHIHLKDQVGFKGSFDFPALGDGEVHFHEIFRILAKHKWKGPMSVELEYEGPGKPLKRPSEIDDDAKRSRNFIARLIERYFPGALK